MRLALALVALTSAVAAGAAVAQGQPLNPFGSPIRSKQPFPSPIGKVSELSGEVETTPAGGGFVFGFPTTYRILTNMDGSFPSGPNIRFGLDPTITGTSTSGGTRNATTFWNSRVKARVGVTNTVINLQWGVQFRSAGTTNWAFLGDAPGTGGGYAHFYFGLDTTGVSVPEQKCMFGMMNTPIALSGVGVQPSTQTDWFGVGFDSNQTTFRVMHNDAAGASSTVDLGASFPTNTSTTDWYQLRLFWERNATSVEVTLVNMTTGVETVTTVNSNLPAGTTSLSFVARCGNGNSNTGGSALIAYQEFYAETPGPLTEPQRTTAVANGVKFPYSAKGFVIPKWNSTTADYARTVVGVRVGSNFGTLTPSVSSYYLARLRRLNFIASNVASQQVGFQYQTGGAVAAAYLFLGDNPRTGGGYWRLEFGMNHDSGAVLARRKCLVGMVNTIVALNNTTTQPSDQTNWVGVGFDSTETTFRVMHNDAAGVSTEVDLGANFPANTVGTDWYNLELYWEQNASSVEVTLTNFSTGDTATTVVSTDLPAGNVGMAPTIRCGNDSSTAAGNMQIEMGSFYYETPGGTPL